MLFVKASGVHTEPSSVQASLLVNLIGADGFDIYQTFTFETESERDDVNVLLKKFDSYFGTKPNITLMRYKFFTRNQEEGESIQQYVTALRLMSKNCKFDSLEEDLIRDRIVCGVSLAAVRDRLLRSDELTLDKAVKICQAEEVSQESGRQMCNSSASTSKEVIHVDGIGVYNRGRGGPAAPAARRGASRVTARRRTSAVLCVVTRDTSRACVSQFKLIIGVELAVTFDVCMKSNVVAMMSIVIRMKATLSIYRRLILRKVVRRTGFKH